MKPTDLPSNLIPLSVMKRMLFFSYQPPILVLQIIAAIFVLITAVQFLKLKPWSRTGLEMFSWVYVVYIFGSHLFVYFSFMAYFSSHPIPGANLNLPPFFQTFNLVGGALYTAIWTFPTFIIIYFLRRQNVLEAFKPEVGPPEVTGPYRDKEVGVVEKPIIEQKPTEVPQVEMPPDFKGLAFVCPKCDGPIYTKYLKVGETAKCRNCGVEVIVPADAKII